MGIHCDEFLKGEVLQKGRGIEKHIIFFEDARIPATTMNPDPPPDAICGSSPQG